MQNAAIAAAIININNMRIDIAWLRWQAASMYSICKHIHRKRLQSRAFGVKRAHTEKKQQ